MTITEFLNARYDEEEVRAGVYRDIAARLTTVFGPLDPDAEGIHVGVAAHVALARTADRIVADIAAKRALLQWLDQMDREAEQEGLERYRLAGDFDTDPARQILAQPFAEHADFDPAWRA